jgi:mono/diheme cytochrome c family protein
METAVLASIDFARTRRAALAAALVCAPLIASGADSSVPGKNPYSGSKEVAAEGASLLNQYCAHCHGQWAEQGERPRDLRRLNIRYGNDASAMFWSTVAAGRLDKDIPVWKSVLPDDTLWKIYTFLETVQSED